MPLNSAVEMLKNRMCPIGKDPYSSACWGCVYSRKVGYAYLVCSFVYSLKEKKGESRKRKETTQRDLFNNGPGTGSGPRF